MPGRGKDFEPPYLNHEKRLQPIPWVDLTPGLFAEGSYGRERFPEIWHGRLRPVTIFDRPLSSLWTRGENQQARTVEQAGIATVTQLLNAPRERVEALPEYFDIRRHVGIFAEDVAIPPHGRVIGIGRRNLGIQYSFPAQFEPEIIRGVEEAIASIPVSADFRARNIQPDVLRLFYGLEDGIPKSFQEIGNVYGISPAAVRNYYNDALRKLQRHKFILASEDYLTLPHESIGRTRFHAIFKRDLPELLQIDKFAGAMINLLKDDYLEAFRNSLSDGARTELNKIFPKGYALYDAVALDLQRTPLPVTSQNEIVEAIRRYLLTTEPPVLLTDKRGEQPPSQQSEYRPTEEELEFQRNLGNQFILEVALTEEQFQSLADRLIDDENSSLTAYDKQIFKKAGIKTLGDLLKLTKAQFRDLRGAKRSTAYSVYRVIYHHFTRQIPEWVFKTLSDYENEVDAYNSELNKIHSLYLPKGLLQIEDTLLALFPVKERKKGESFPQEKIDQYIAQRRAEKEQVEKQQLLQWIAFARRRGLNSPEEIHGMLMTTQKGKKIFGVHPDSWVVRAMIEYVLKEEER